MTKASEQIDERTVIDLAKRLVNVESSSGNEKRLVTLIGIEMKKHGFELVKYDDNNNIIGVISASGKARGKSLVLAGHLDTAPAGLMVDPYTPKEMDGAKLGTRGKVIAGRGACDMKGALAAMIVAGGTLKRARIRLKGNFVVAGLANCESGLTAGIKEILQKFELSPDYIVSCKPTNLAINTAHPGLAVFDIIAKGRMASIGNGGKGENAIIKMNKIIDCLLTNVFPPEDKRFGKAKMAINSVSSKPMGNPYSIPDYCKVTLVKQFFKGINPEEIKKELIEVIKKNGFKEQDVEIKLKRVFSGLDVAEDSELITILQEVTNEVLGKSAKISHWSYGTNICALLDTDLPVVGYGPGDEQYSHTPAEHVPVEQLVKAAKVYAALGEKICTSLKDSS